MPEPTAPFTVDGYPRDPLPSIAEARIFAGQKQRHDQRSMQIRDASGNVVDLKRF